MTNLKSTQAGIRRTILKTVFLNIFIFPILLFFLKIIRNLLPPPEILKNKIIGFSQYSGYPLYLDSIVFVLLLLIPVTTFLLLFNYKKSK